MQNILFINTASLPGIYSEGPKPSTICLTRKLKLRSFLPYLETLLTKEKTLLKPQEDLDLPKDQSVFSPLCSSSLQFSPLKRTYKPWQRCMLPYSHSSCLHIPVIKNTPNSHSKLHPGSQDGDMRVGKEGWRLESLEGKDKANSSYHDIPSPHLGDGILSKALDLWTCGVGELRQLTTTH